MSTLFRSRWAAFGAAVAVTLGAGGIGLVDAAKGSGERSVYTAIEPCRLLDTRPNQGIGGRTAPLGPAEIYKLTAHGDNGQCTGIPADTLALELNVTGLLNTAGTDFVIWSGAGDPPNASQLNLALGASATPNSVTTELDGPNFSIRNKFGQAHVIIDIVGIYQDHNHDDRYYTQTAVDSSLAGKANAADTYTKTQVDSSLATKANATDTYTKAQTYTKTEVDSALNTKANAADTYTKTQVDGALANKADSSVTARLPTAYGHVTAGTTVSFRGVGIASVTKNAALGRYEIELDEPYSIFDYAVATIAGSYSSCPANTSIRQTSVSGNLLIYVLLENGAFATNCSFDFVTFSN